MKPFAIDRHGRLALPCHFSPPIDFSALDSVEQLTAVMQRDFDSKDPSGAELLRRLDSGAYRNRYELLRDLALHLFWVNRFWLISFATGASRPRSSPRCCRRSRNSCRRRTRSPCRSRSTIRISARFPPRRSSTAVSRCRSSRR
ncbi:MAG: hypothetical protein ACREUL_02615 [Steroidobacteraceae bacterium]